MSDFKSTIAEDLKLYDAEAETTALAGIKDGSTATAIELIQALNPTEFFGPRHAIVFEAMKNLLNGIEPLTTANIIAESERVRVERKSKLKIDSEFLKSITGDAEAATNNVKSIQDWAFARSIAPFAEEFLYRLQLKPDIGEFCGWATSALSNLVPEMASSKTIYGWESVQWHREIQLKRAQEKSEGKRLGWNWPWSSWNEIVRPLRSGLLGMLIAPDGFGKSAMLSQIAEHWATMGHVVLVHLEDDPEYKMDRRLARYTGIPIETIEDEAYTPEQRKIKEQTEEYLESAKWAQQLHYHYAPGDSAAEIILHLESMAKKGMCDAVVIDYTNKIQPDARQLKLFGSNGQYARQSDDMEQLKVFAAKANEKRGVPIFTAAQGNKEIVEATRMSRKDMHGSSEVFHKCQLIMIGRRKRISMGEVVRDPFTSEIVAEGGDMSPVCELRIDKQNRGKETEFKSWYDGARYTFRDDVVFEEVELNNY